MIEILMPQKFQVGLTEAMERAMKNVKNRTVIHKPYSSKDHLATLLAQKPEPGVKRIVLTGQETSGLVAQLAEDSSDLFNDIRVSNIELPDNYSSLDSNEKTFCQARVILTAILMRLYEKDDTPMVKYLLESMLKDCVNNLDEGEGIAGFLNKMAGSADETTEQVKSRILYCLEKTVSLVAKVAAEMEHIRLLMKEVWSKA